MRLLLLPPFPPRADATHGGGRVVAGFLAEIAARHEVGVLCFRDADEPGADPSFRDRCAFVEEIVRPASTDASRIRRSLRLGRALAGLQPPWVADWSSAGFASRLRGVAARFAPDVVQAESHVMGRYLSELEGPARVLVVHEPGARAAAYVRDVPGVLAAPLRRLEVASWRRYESHLYPSVDSIVVYTREDERSVRRFSGATGVEVIPPGTELPGEPSDPLGTSPPRVLFVGSFIHPPNADAAARLIRRIFPAVRRQIPDARLLVVGDRPPAELRGAADEHVIVTGRVPDVAPYLDEAAVVVAPMFLGGGLRIKVLEALAAGKAVVATPRAVEGLGGAPIAVAEDDRAIAERIVELLKDGERRGALAGRARAWAERHAGWGRAVDAYESLYRRLLDRSSSRSSDGARRSR
jgi:glycosyltransferase involved in cell wall biosynthesis